MKKRQGYTLIELILVVGIMVVLAVLSAPALAPMLRRRALVQGANQVKAALLRARTAAIAQEPGSIQVLPICLRAQPPRWALPTNVSEWFGGTNSNSYPKYWDGGSTSWKTDWVDETSPPDTSFSVGGGMFGNCWTHTRSKAAIGDSAYAFGFDRSDDGEPNDDNDDRKEVASGDVLGMWVYLGPLVEGVGFSVRADDDTGADKGWTATMKWGTGIPQGGAEWFVDKGELPQKGKWIQLAASIGEMGIKDNWYLTGMKFRQYTSDSNGCQTWWDRVVVWKNVYTLPDFIVPDLTQFPIEFEKDGRLKAGRVNMDYDSAWKPAMTTKLSTQWYDRMIILKDVRDRELQHYLDTFDNDTGYGGDKDGFWECEAFDDPDGWGDGLTAEYVWDYGLDRVKGTTDSGESDNTWDFEGNGLTDEPTVVPNGQIYIKVNKITGVAKVCRHPGE